MCLLTMVKRAKKRFGSIEKGNSIRYWLEEFRDSQPGIGSF